MDGEQLFELPDEPRHPHPSRQDAGSSNGNGVADGRGVSAIPDLSEAQERIAARVDALTDTIRGVEGTVRETLEAAVADLRTDLEVVRSLPTHVARALQIVRSAVTEIADSQDGVGDRMAAIEAALQAVREEMGGFAAALEERMAGVDRLTAAIESLGRKRGFKDLVQSEQRAVQQQEEQVSRLVAAAETLAGRVDEVESAVSGIVDRLRTVDASRREDLTPILSQVRERLAGALQDLRDRVATDLAAGLEAIRVEVGTAPSPADGSEHLVDLAAGQKETDQALRAARAELARIRKRMDSWGRARSAPRIADEVAGLEERVVELERSVHEELTDAVADRVEAHLDRRFEALVQLIESRITALMPVEEDERRGFFRRR